MQLHDLADRVILFTYYSRNGIKIRSHMHEVATLGTHGTGFSKDEEEECRRNNPFQRVLVMQIDACNMYIDRCKGRYVNASNYVTWTIWMTTRVRVFSRSLYIQFALRVSLREIRLHCRFFSLPSLRYKKEDSSIVIHLSIIDIVNDIKI